MSAQQDMDAILREDVSNSRDLVARLEYLGVDDWENPDFEDLDADERDEAECLVSVLTEISTYSEDSVTDGVTLIRKFRWTAYVQQYAEDIGAVNSEASWPNNCIDWDLAADCLAQDYTEIELDGADFYVR